MLFLYILLIILALFTLLSFLRIRVIFTFKEKLLVEVRVLFLKFLIVGKKKVKEKEITKQKKTKPKAKKKEKDAEEKTPKSKKPSVKDIIILIREAVKPLLEKFFKYIKIDYYDMDIIVATGDAASTAISYGAASGAFYSLLSLLHSVKPVRRRLFGLKRGESNARIMPDFTADKPIINATISFSITLWPIVACAILGGKGFILFYKTKNTKS